MSTTYKSYKCEGCGAINNIEVKFCSNCGAENVARLELIAKLEARTRKTERDTGRARHARKSGSMRMDMARELAAGGLARKARRLKLEKARLVTGGTHEGKLRWIKEQLDLNKTVTEIAEELGESMFKVAKYVDEINSNN